MSVVDRYGKPERPTWNYTRSMGDDVDKVDVLEMLESIRNAIEDLTKAVKAIGKFTSGDQV